MTIKKIEANGHIVMLEQHDGKNDTFYVVSRDGKALAPVSNLTLALHFFDSLSEKTYDN